MHRKLPYLALALAAGTIVYACSDEPPAGPDAEVLVMAEAPAPKIDICHNTGTGTYQSISISSNAEAAHRAHGDALPGEPVPDMPGFFFTDACALNAAPSVEITAPADASTVTAGDDVTFEGSGNDPEDGALTGGSLVWTSNVDGEIGTGTSFTKSDLSPGPHTITLTGTDSEGISASATLTITVNQPPTVEIAAPTDGSTFTAGDDVTFEGSGNDPEDGPLTGGSLVWTSNVDGQIGTGTSFSTSSLSEGEHTITLTGTDSDGATGTATATVTIDEAEQGLGSYLDHYLLLLVHDEVREQACTPGSYFNGDPYLDFATGLAENASAWASHLASTGEFYKRLPAQRQNVPNVAGAIFH